MPITRQRTNAFAGRCARCNTWVPEERGTLVKTPAGQWAIECRVPCEEQVSRRAAAKSPAETWAAESLRRLAGLDGDRARSLNGVGFSKFDSARGHWLADHCEQGLTPKLWDAAFRLLGKYHRQVGFKPA